MSARDRFIKVRVSSREYDDIFRRAETAQKTISDYLRTQVLAGHIQLDIVDELASLRGLMAHPAPAAANDETLLMETVLLLRELAAARDTQILSRVRAQMQQRQGKATA